MKMLVTCLFHERNFARRVRLTLMWCTMYEGVNFSSSFFCRSITIQTCSTDQTAPPFNLISFAKFVKKYSTVIFPCNKTIPSFWLSSHGLHRAATSPTHILDIKSPTKSFEQVCGVLWVVSCMRCIRNHERTRISLQKIVFLPVCLCSFELK